MKARQVMSRPVWTARKGETLEAAARRMWDHDVGSLPVVDPHDVLIGVLTDRDIAMAAVDKRLPLMALHVEEAMTTRLHTCGPDDTIEVVAAVLSRNRVHRLPIVERDGTLLGVLSVGDLARAADEGQGVSPLTVVQVLRAVSTPEERLVH